MQKGEEKQHVERYEVTNPGSIGPCVRCSHISSSVRQRVGVPSAEILVTFIEYNCEYHGLGGSRSDLDDLVTDSATTWNRECRR